MQQVSGSGQGTFWRHHLPAVAYGILVLGLSSIPNLGGPESPIVGFDKVVHCIEYGLFAVLVYRSFSHLLRNWSATGVLAACFVFLAIFAMGDEYLQSFVQGRDSSVADLAADVIGALAALLFLRYRMHWNRS